MSSMRQVLGVAVALLLIAEERAVAADVEVTGAAELRAAVAAAKPGTRLLLADAQQPPVFRDGSAGMHFSNPAYVELHNLVFTKLAHNGINIDDVGGKTNGSARGVVLRGLRISDVGSEGNHDGIKLSGIWDFRVTGCTIERWGTRGGSAIDMVGCHRGVIESNEFLHNPEPQNCSGVQGKGGTSDIMVRRNRFEHAGGRAVNIGGSTGLQFFRPALVEGGEHAEARNLRVEGNTFIGSTPVAFVGVDGAVVRFNTIERPNRWALRILQETKAPGFVACRNGEFSDNTIVFDSTRWSEGGVNIGAGTAPDTFKFARNWWYCADDPKRSRPRLPTAEVDGKYGQPVAEAKGKAGAEALPE